MHKELGIFLSVYVDEKMVGKKTENGTHVETSAERNLEDPTPLIDQGHLGCTQRDVKG